MIITDIRVTPVKSDGKLRAFVAVTLDDEIAVHGIRIVEGQNGLIIVMPCRKTPDGEYKDIVHPINTAARTKLQDRILSVYHEMVDPVNPD
ncbi:septation regulator SpoVG [Gehongia tenuis]|uniref:Septation regulator SpoVG n=1 Tax=Gehongia tenuis TaxID=2763655 RepID=A0A926D5S3_9FIRM|nr:septation regulator SpoVG [Gehongia tenuis]MBC8531952.1 septation regulator SpoVG [Gehongia tenuis]